jgi:DNA-binding response OmpR family regulator
MRGKPAKDCAVLVVEDDASIRRLVRTVLAREGYQVDVANDGIEAVLQMGIVDYDIILLDLMMPNLDGFEFLTTMAEHAPERIKRVIVTSAASPAVIQTRLKGIDFDLLPKPFDLPDLIAHVRNRLDAQPVPQPPKAASPSQ